MGEHCTSVAPKPDVYRPILRPNMNTHTYLRAAQAAWFGLIFITLAWDGWYAPLHTGYWLPAIKLLPLLLPLRGIMSGRVYTYQYCSMLILAYFAESVMRLWDMQPASRLWAAAAMLCTIVFFVCNLAYLKQFKTPRKGKSS